MSIQLTVMSLDFDSSAAPTTKVYEKDEITLGRLPGNDLVLDKPEVSGYHARLRLSGTGGSEPTLLVKDLGSSNGTMVENNSLRAQVEVEVQPNQRIIIGNYLIKPSVAEDSNAVSIPIAEHEQEPQAMQELMQANSSHIPSSSLEDESVIATQVFNFTTLSGDNTEHSGPQPIRDRDPDATQAFHASTISDDWITAEAPESSSEPVASNESVVNFDTESDSSITVEVSGGDIGLDFSAVELLTVEGTLLHKGQPLEGVALDAGELGTTTTDSRGRYSFAKVAEGTKFSLRATKDGFDFDVPNSLTAGSDTAAIEIGSYQLFDIGGVVEHRGTPLAGVAVDAGNLGKETTNEAGCFRFENLREGTSYSITLRKDGFLFDTDSFSGTDAPGLAGLAATARQLFRITGVVKHHETPLAGVVVDGGPELGTTETDANGQYVFENVPEDAKYTLSVRKDDFKFQAIKK